MHLVADSYHSPPAKHFRHPRRHLRRRPMVQFTCGLAVCVAALVSSPGLREAVSPARLLGVFGKTVVEITSCSISSLHTAVSAAGDAPHLRLAPGCEGDR
ncbi:MAG: hypothetical protein KJN93_05580 [Alphaproteobacteria bacterium]|nr:hypothetical protein [Alphaproteobacteria bacterium]